jgi:formyltetrahydrofolate deformylase
VDHAQSPEQLAAIGQDIEAQVLTRALKYQLEHRVLLNGTKTVVFK